MSTRLLSAVEAAVEEAVALADVEATTPLAVEVDTAVVEVDTVS